MNQNNLYQKMISILFLAYIGMSVIFNLISPDLTFSESENRMLQQKPYFSFKKIIDGKWISQYEKYFTDQFIVRDFWIGIRSDTERIFGKKENNNVYLGKESYLMEAFQKPSEENFNKKLKELQSFSDSTPNTNKYFLLVPNAVSILKDKLPSYAPTDDQLFYIEKLKKNMIQNIRFLDIYPTLYNRKNEYIFYKTDHHWTTKGAYYAYEKIAKDMGFTPYKKEDFKIQKVTDKFYGSLYSKSGFRHIKPDDIELYIPKKENQYKVEYIEENKVDHSFYKLDNLEKKDKYKVFFDGNHPLIKISSEQENTKKLLMIKDSYANSLIPFLALHYSDIYVVDLRYYQKDLQELIDKNHIEDVLILYNENTFFQDSIE
ncbi:DHHW family protein [Inediibacterium massiliense]|uniref:DHHW family protein n=1 Tax=Inediibacterium massiliense TaxID=1658111 RepID=UPI0006B66893|nr:DHHW family protein [Inediibacterium massiliense]